MYIIPLRYQSVFVHKFPYDTDNFKGSISVVWR